MAAEDKQIVNLLICRHTSAWNQFVRQYSNLVMSRVRSTAAHCYFELDQADLDDICAEVFASLLENDFRALKSFKGQSRLSTWLSVIAHRVCLRQLTLIRSRQALEAPSDLLHAQHFQYHRNLLNELIDSEQQSEVAATMATLGEKDRFLLELFYNRQLSYKEISSETGLSVNSVGPKLNRAIARLRKAMNQKSDEVVR